MSRAIGSKDSFSIWIHDENACAARLARFHDIIMAILELASTVAMQELFIYVKIGCGQRRIVCYEFQTEVNSTFVHFAPAHMLHPLPGVSWQFGLDCAAKDPQMF